MQKSSLQSAIHLRGVRHNNLKNFNLDLPLNQLIVITGLSGSGKSSLAFDTLFAEGQRRYIETFSPYARQFFDRMDKPQVDSIEGIPPSIAIEQRNAVRTTRSTVGTMTELCDYMKMLWPHLAQLHCRQCGQPVRKESPQTIWEWSQSQTGLRQAEVLVTFEVPLSARLSLKDSLQLVSKQGYQRLLLDNQIVRIEQFPASASVQSLVVIQDRLKFSDDARARFIEACEQAYHFGKGKLTLHPLPGADAFKPHAFTSRLHCATCDLEYAEPTPALFSFNHPVGACPTCRGFGRTISIDYNLAMPDRSKTLAEGVVKPWLTGMGTECQDDLMRMCRQHGVPTDVPFEKLPQKWQDFLILGEPGYGSDAQHQWPRAWYGVKGYFRWLESKSYKMHVRVLLSRYRAYTPCPDCHGRRFQPDSLLYRWDNAQPAAVAGTPEPPSRSLTLADFYQLCVRDALAFIGGLNAQRPRSPGDPLGMILGEVHSRLRYLQDVGLGYLTLDRPTRSLSGGETERVSLTTCLGTRLVNTLFVLDEPSVGLHPRDTERLVRILQQLRDAKNTVVVVEHEASVMRAADQIVDLGPGHGATGGQVVFQGSYPQILQSAQSLTGQYLSGRKKIEVPQRRPVTLSGAQATPSLLLSGAGRHNLQNLSVQIPLGRFVCVTGVSGSGKTTLVREVLLPALLARLKMTPEELKASDRLDSDETDSDEQAEASGSTTGASLEGTRHLGRVVLVDQSILGKTPRSNPAVYIGAFDELREFFAQTEVAHQRGLNASAFSFNSAQGQCERCRGAGFEKIEMQFLSDVFIRCPDCNGSRYRAHILEVKVPAPDHSQSLSIADMLDATVDEIVEFLSQFPDSKPAQRALQSLSWLQEVGLGYLKLGQPINTLSGGESQRLKLVRELALASASEHAAARPTLFLFDEPTTGLHFEDVRVLLKVFQRLVNAGHSVLVIEHNLDVIQSADWLIDLGPDAGDQGGHLVAAGTPETVAASRQSYTGQALQALWRQAGLPAAKSSPLPDGPRSASALILKEPSASPALKPNSVSIYGAREHNLKNVSLDLPRGRFVVVTGVSGSGKSTLAFDLLFAEGQRRFLDSMNVYARQFVEQLARPDVDLITGIPPTVSIEQRSSRGGGKSTVATVTEVYHFIRLLFARLGVQYCPDCHIPVQAQTRDEVGRHLQTELRKRGALKLLAPVVKNRKGFHTDVAEWAAKHGYAQIRADGELRPASELLRLDRFREHNVEIVIGSLKTAQRALRPRPTEKSPDAVEIVLPQQLIDEALKLGNGMLLALDSDDRTTIHSTERSCPQCGRSFEMLDPKNFSYNSPRGWCPRCRGFGELFYLPEVERGARAEDIEESWFNWQEGERELCPDCQGSRLNSIARAVRLPLGGAHSDAESHPTIDAISALSVEAAYEFFRKLKLSTRAAVIARDILPEIRVRLQFLCEVGLGYMSLGRGVPTLSGGESQRIRLAAQLGSNLSGVLYILDEPTIGLHARDNERLLASLEKLKARGNSVLVVEHDEETMRRADYIIDLGPGAGVRGGQVVAAGTLPELLRHPDSITGQCLRVHKSYPTRGQRRQVTPGTKSKKNASPWLTLNHASKNNLRDLTARFPLGRLVLITGVSGSGKSTLVRECLLPTLTDTLKSSRNAVAAPKDAMRVSGFEGIHTVYEVDQSPIGRTPRSVPATYVGFFDDIRKLFAQVPEARLRGYGPGRFSFNSPQGRCPECEGAGEVKLEMNFLPPAFVRCEVCGGTRFNRETLDIRYNGKNIAEVLELSAEEALQFFESLPRIKRPLQALCDTGLGYLKLGQTSPTLSGGEAQRVKLVTHLLSGLRAADPADPLPHRNLFILEEPTIGLHMADVQLLVDVLQRLVDAGHSVLVIEHNLELIAEADWIIDLGPEGGKEGGSIIAEGTPEQVSRVKTSYTGRFLAPVLK